MAVPMTIGPIGTSPGVLHYTGPRSIPLSVMQFGNRGVWLVTLYGQNKEDAACDRPLHVIVTNKGMTGLVKSSEELLGLLLQYMDQTCRGYPAPTTGSLHPLPSDVRERIKGYLPEHTGPAIQTLLHHT